MKRAVSIVSALGLAVFLVAAARLASLERAGPPHADLLLEHEIPATLHLPGSGSGSTAFWDPPPRDEAPPALVLAHGFAADRRSVGSLARRLAASGYAVLALDLSGHGENRRPYARHAARSDAFHAEFAAALDFLRTSPHVDGSRIAVMGQSMGAGAALDYATRDSGIDGAVMISGGWDLNGPYRPPNALFLYAEGDPERIRRRADELAARLAGVSSVERGQTYGELGNGTAVRVVEIRGTDHASIAWSEGAVTEVVGWLDRVFGLDRPSAAPPCDPRMGVVVVIGFSLLLVLPGLGIAVGHLVPRGEALPAAGRGVGLLALLFALGATMPALAVATPAAMVPLEVADALIGHFLLAGVALLAFLALGGHVQVASLFRGLGPTLLVAALGVIALFALLGPLSLFLHRLPTTPERLFAFLIATGLLLPFSLALQLLLRRGSPLGATLYAAAGRALVVFALLAGVRVGLLDDVLLFFLGPLVLFFVLFEWLDAAIYAVSRNLLAIAVIDSAWLALVLAAIMPIRI